jgi:hypothetical protein
MYRPGAGEPDHVRRVLGGGELAQEIREPGDLVSPSQRESRDGAAAVAIDARLGLLSRSLRVLLPDSSGHQLLRYALSGLNTRLAAVTF